MNTHVITAAGLVLVVALSGLSFFWDTPALVMEMLVGKNILLGAGIFVLLMFSATVVAPVTVLPLVPLVAPIFGPFVTAILSILGWTLGAVVAFLIARHAGRPLLAKLVSLEVLDRYEKHIPPDMRFWAIVVLRIIIPVDVLSYALGLFSRVPLLQYTLATILGVSFFSFVFSYLGDAAAEDDIRLFGGITALALAVLGFSWWFVVKKMRHRRTSK